MLLDGLGLDKDATLAYIQQNKPTYVQFEAWVKENASNLGGAAGLQRRPLSATTTTTRPARASSARLAFPAPTSSDAVNLNNLEDWNDFHGQEVAG